MLLFFFIFYILKCSGCFNLFLLIQLLQTELELDIQEILVLLICDSELFSTRQLTHQEFHQLGLTYIVLQCHRWLSGDQGGGSLSSSCEAELLLYIEENLILNMLLVPRPLESTRLA